MLEIVEYTGTTDSAGNAYYTGATEEERKNIREIQRAVGAVVDGKFGPGTLAKVNAKLGTNYPDVTTAINQIDEIMAKLGLTWWTPTKVKVAWGLGLGVVSYLGYRWWKKSQEPSYGASAMMGVFSRARLGRARLGRSLGQTRQQNRFGRAAKLCAGRPGPSFRACMSRRLSG